MSDKHLSGEEKRALLKQQFKKDLLQRQEFLRKTKNLRQLQNINRAMSEMAPQDDTDEWINKLNEESAFSEAKMEIAVETAKERAQQQHTEAEMEKIIAESMVEQMKKEMMEEALIKGDVVDTSDIESSSDVGGEEDAKPSEENNGPARRTFGDREL